MSEWKKVKLGDCCFIGDGAHASLKRQEKGILYITAKNLTSNGLDYSRVDYISEELYNKHFSEKNGAITRPIKNDIIFSIIGSLGDSYLVKDEKLGISSSVAIFRSKGDILPLYLFYYLKSEKIKSEIDSIKGGVAQGFMSLSKLGSLTIYLPTSLKLQQRVAETLSRYDSLIENYQKQIKLLEESTQRLYKEWFIDLRFPEHENTKIVDGVPEGWKKKKVKDLVDLKSGYAFKSSAFVGEGKYKIVTIKNVKDGVFDGDNVSYLNTVPEKMPSHCLLQTGDILLSLTGNVGRVCMVIGDNYLLNQRVAKLESNFPAFTYCHFRYYDTFVAINNLANGAAQQNVSPIRIGEMDMLVANDKIMHHFEKAAENIRTNILKLFSQIRHLTEARDRLLPKLMSGEIEV
jgi:type I restriction enzyme S subunit